jgi:hypothetical protein
MYLLIEVFEFSSGVAQPELALDPYGESENVGKEQKAIKEDVAPVFVPEQCAPRDEETQLAHERKRGGVATFQGCATPKAFGQSPKYPSGFGRVQWESRLSSRCTDLSGWQTRCWIAAGSQYGYAEVLDIATPASYVPW